MFFLNGQVVHYIESPIKVSSEALVEKCTLFCKSCMWCKGTGTFKMLYH